MAMEAMPSWHFCLEKTHRFCRLWGWRCVFLQPGAWAKPRSSSLPANMLSTNLVSQFLASGINSKFLCKRNKGLHHLAPPDMLASSSASRTCTWVPVVSKYRRIFCVLHVWMHCSLQHFLALLMGMASSSSFPCYLEHACFLSVSS